jgi:hypothetical protein
MQESIVRLFDTLLLNKIIFNLINFKQDYYLIYSILQRLLSLSKTISKFTLFTQDYLLSQILHNFIRIYYPFTSTFKFEKTFSLHYKFLTQLFSQSYNYNLNSRMLSANTMDYNSI